MGRQIRKTRFHRQARDGRGSAREGGLRNQLVGFIASGGKVPDEGSQVLTLVPVHTSLHASWLNQIEIYFSIVLVTKLRRPSFVLTRRFEAKLRDCD